MPRGPKGEKRPADAIGDQEMSEQKNDMTAWQMNNAGRVLFAVGTTGTTFLVFKWLAG